MSHNARYFLHLQALAEVLLDLGIGRALKQDGRLLLWHYYQHRIYV